jgi:tripartite-type tricarboxylate transporter receptor subunit TctC
MLKKILAAAVWLIAASVTQAQGYPTKPITFVVPYPAGGGTDVVARSLAEEIGKRLGQPVVVDNRPGASGILGTMAVVKAPADGHTVLISLVQSALTNKFLYQKLPYDTQRDLAFVSEIATGPLVLTTNAQAVPASNLKEFLAWAAKNKGKVNYGSWGAGSYPHLAGALISKTGDLDMTHVAYKGEAPMVQDLVAGQITFTVGAPMTMKPYIDSGRLRALAVTGRERSSVLPQVPTFAQAGIKDHAFALTGWLGMLVPANTPKPVIAALEKATREAVQSTAVQARFQVLGLQGIGSTAEQFRKDYETDLPTWERLVNVSGARLD